MFGYALAVKGQLSIVCYNWIYIDLKRRLKDCKVSLVIDSDAVTGDTEPNTFTRCTWIC
jgi:hypothetical protein